MSNLSPSINIQETVYSNVTTNQQSSVAAYVGLFQRGEANVPILLNSSADLVRLFGTPINDNVNHFFTVYNYLAYPSAAYVVRALSPTDRNAVSTQSGSVSTVTITSAGTGYVTAPQLAFSAAPAGGVTATGIATVLNGSINNVIITNPGAGYVTAPTITMIGAPGSGAVLTPNIITSGAFIPNRTSYETNFSYGSNIFGSFAARYAGSYGNGIMISAADSASYSTWEYKRLFTGTPGTSDYVSVRGGSNDEMHIVVVDTLGSISGTPNTVLETFAFVSKASDAINTNGQSSYWLNVISNTAQNIWGLSQFGGASNNWGTTCTNTSFTTLSTPFSTTLSGGSSSYVTTDAIIEQQWNLFLDKDRYTIDFILGGAASPNLAQFLVNFAANRQDCVAYVSPVNVTTNAIILDVDPTAVQDIENFRNALPAGKTGSYGFLDSGYKYQYDQWNDVYRWIPLNGDIAGLSSRTDFTNAAWWSPAGFNRGQIQNVAKLSYNPQQADRDVLYQMQINPVVNFLGQGTILFGDTTLQDKNDPFQSINIRRLFIVLERSIGKMAKQFLFEFNDSITQSMFVNSVAPFLRQVQAARGISDFKVICDSTNNTPQVVQSKQFVGTILVKPAYSINYVNLSFVAVGATVSFSQVGG